MKYYKLLILTIIASLYIFLPTQNAFAFKIYPPFNSAQSGHLTNESKIPLTIAVGVSLNDPNGDIDATNGKINQNAFAGAIILGAARANVNDYIDIPLPVSQNGWYEIKVKGVYSDEISCAGGSYFLGVSICQYSASIEAHIYENNTIWLGDWLIIDSTSLGGVIGETLLQASIDVIGLLLYDISKYTDLVDIVNDAKGIYTLMSSVIPEHKRTNATFELPIKAFLETNKNYSLRVKTHSMADSYAGGAASLISNVDLSIAIQEIEIIKTNSSDEIQFSINSLPYEGIDISLDKLDLYGKQNGVTPFSRSFYENEVVQFTAPLNNVSGYHFREWRVNGAFYSNDNPAFLNLGDNSQVTAVYEKNKDPILFNFQVLPSKGTVSTNYEYLVDYYDPDGDPPIVKELYIDGNGPYTMTLKNGIPADGTYTFQTDLQTGIHNYFFSFIEGNGGVVMSTIYTGPSVFTSNSSVGINVDVNNGPVTNNIKIKFQYGPDLQNLQSQEWFAPQLPQYVGINSGQQLMFSANVDSNNHTFDKWVFKDDNGNILRESTASGYGFTLLSDNIHATAYLTYTPINYTISGTVLRGDGTQVPGGVTLTLNSSEQTMSQTSNDGNFAFTGVKGGISVNITPAANGYAFTPAKIVMSNLESDQTAVSIVTYHMDSIAPTINFISKPPYNSTNPSVTFTWAGQDDVSTAGYLSYQYKLDGVDVDWSAWSSSPTQSYSLPNGAYTFWVRAQDEAGNINQAPASCNFIVNAEPELTSSVSIDRSVWASRVTLTMPSNATNPTNSFILTTQHSGSADPELVPVRIHRAGDIEVLGANTIIASQLGAPVTIVKASEGWLVTLPQSISSGQSEQYDIVWGKIKYFGWKESVDNSLPMPNTDRIIDTFLDDSLNLWRLAEKENNTGWGEESWVLMDATRTNGPVIGETILQFLKGTPFDGTYGSKTGIYGGAILRCGINICLVWADELYEKDKSSGTSEYYRHHRYSLRVFNTEGLLLNSYDSNYQQDTFVDLPSYSLYNGFYITGRTYNSATNKSDLWLVVHDTDGSVKKEKSIYESGSGFSAYRVLTLGSNFIFLFDKSWSPTNGYDRRVIYYQVRDSDGSLVKSSTAINPPLLPDNIDKDDEYEFDYTVTDKQGKVWVSYSHYQSGQGYKYYYIIVGTDGEIWKGPVQTANLREFKFVDMDGYIWANENNQFFVLKADDTIAVSFRTPAFYPSHEVGQIAAQVSTSGYRLYDRWSPQSLIIDVPNNLNPDSMELYDLNLWNNNLHPSNVQLKRGSTFLWSQSGQFTGSATVDLSGVLSQGVNVLELTQDDFLGGQLLVTFPDLWKIDLIAGWNLMSQYLQPSNNSISNVLSTIDGNYQLVVAYDNGLWPSYDPVNPAQSDLLTLDSGEGYWIYMTQATSLPISGMPPSKSISLVPDWNLVGYNSSMSQPIAGALNSISGQYISVWSFENGRWKVYDPNNPGFSDLTDMKPGYGYWINTLVGTTWTLP